jgi:hypothetical protein
MEKLLNQYHSLFLTKSEVKEIFRLKSDKALNVLKREFGIRKRGQHYLASDVRKVIAIFSEEAA